MTRKNRDIRLATFFLWMAAAGPSTAADIPSPYIPASCGDILMPPMDLMHIAAPAGVNVFILNGGTYQNTMRICSRNLLRDENEGAPWACSSRLASGSWQIVLPGDMAPDATMCLYVHELAHIWGWRWDHPGARFISQG